jgi:hypothetical protein
MKRSIQCRHGLTVTEVLFAVGIVLVGLIGIATMVPFAARQANESYRITQAMATGTSAVEMSRSVAVARPTEERPWQIIDDVVPVNGVGDSNESVFSSLQSVYGGPDTNQSSVDYSLYRYQFQNIPDYPTQHTAVNDRQSAWINMNRALGTCFYMDPLFWGQQAGISSTKVLHDDPRWAPFRRTRFPYYSEVFRPSSFTTTKTPRLTRITLHDVNSPWTQANNGWLKLSAARSVAVSFGGDLTIADKDIPTAPPARSFIRNQNAKGASILMRANNAPSNTSWAMMMCPDELTPMIPPSYFPTGLADYQGMPVPFFPESYDISVVVYGKRDIGELSPNSSLVDGLATGEVLPEAEKLASVTWDSGEVMNSGMFEVTLHADPRLNANIIAGDWIMLSRNVIHFEASIAGYRVLRQRHRWYRVVSQPLSSEFPVKVRLSGLPWDWTIDEIKSSGAAFPLGAPQPLPPNVSLYNPDPSATAPVLQTQYYPETQTVATIVPNIVHVYQRTLPVRD